MHIRWKQKIAGIIVEMVLLIIDKYITLQLIWKQILPCTTIVLISFYKNQIPVHCNNRRKKKNKLRRSLWGKTNSTVICIVVQWYSNSFTIEMRIINSTSYCAPGANWTCPGVFSGYISPITSYYWGWTGGSIVRVLYELQCLHFCPTMWKYASVVSLQSLQRIHTCKSHLFVRFVHAIITMLLVKMSNHHPWRNITYGTLLTDSFLLNEFRKNVCWNLEVCSILRPYGK